MTPGPYARLSLDELILRDVLALERTLLANERTFLAYLRSAVALVLAGVTFLHFSEAAWFSVVGVLCIVIGALIAPTAAIRYRRLRSELAELRPAISDARAGIAVHGEDASDS